MAASERSGKTWFKYGCFGCVGVLGFFVLLAAALSGMAMLQVRGEQVEDQVLTHEPPAAPAPAATREATLPVAGTMPGEVILDLKHADFEVEAANPGEPLRVEATYDKLSYRLEESYEETGEKWIYRVSFEQSGSGLISLLKQAFGGTSPELTVYLPTESPLDLDVEVSRGGAEVDLGGLWLTSGRVRAHQGGLMLDVSEPLRAPVERLEIETMMGGMMISHLGNASPRKLDVECNMGGLELDLRGEWLQDSEISIAVSRGGAELRLPRDVKVEGLEEGRLGDVTEAEVELPTLRFTTSIDKRSELEVSY